MGLERILVEAVNSSTNLETQILLVFPTPDGFDLPLLTPVYGSTHFPDSASIPNPINPISLR